MFGFFGDVKKVEKRIFLYSSDGHGDTTNASLVGYNNLRETSREGSGETR